MAWIREPTRLPNGRWRLTVCGDEGGPFGDESHDHATQAQARACDRCDDFCSSYTGSASRARRKTDRGPLKLEARPEAETILDRLRHKIDRATVVHPPVVHLNLDTAAALLRMAECAQGHHPPTGCPSDGSNR